MKLRFATLEIDKVERISFSREELLYMINSLGESEQEAGVLMVFEAFLKELDEKFK